MVDVGSETYARKGACVEDLTHLVSDDVWVQDFSLIIVHCGTNNVSNGDAGGEIITKIEQIVESIKGRRRERSYSRVYCHDLLITNTRDQLSSLLILHYIVAECRKREVKVEPGETLPVLPNAHTVEDGVAVNKEPQKEDSLVNVKCSEDAKKPSLLQGLLGDVFITGVQFAK
jgi:hypothetical protein